MTKTRNLKGKPDKGTRPLRVATYRRVSTEEQAREGSSLETQYDMLQREIGYRENYRFARDYCDPGYTGREADRPGLNRLMTDARQGIIDVVLCTKMDRFMRNLRLLLEYVERLAEWGVGFVPLDYPQMDTSTATGKMVLSVLGAVAQFESDRIGERVSEARLKRRRDGIWPGGQPLYGYKWEAKAKSFVPVQDEAVIVRLIHNLYGIEGLSITQTVEALNARGSRSRTGCLWAEAGVWRILSKETYTGNHPEFTYEPLVDEEAFNRAKRRLAKGRKVLRNPGAYTLQGHIKCGICGHGYCGRTSGHAAVRMYACLGNGRRAHRDGSPRCPNPRLNAEWVEGEVIEALQAAFRSPDILRGHIEAELGAIESELAGLRESTDPVRQEIDRLNAEISRWGVVYAGQKDEQVQTPEHYDAKIEPLVQRRDHLQSQLKVDADREARYQHLLEWRTHVRAILLGAEWYKQREAIVYSSWEEFLLDERGQPEAGAKRLREFMHKYQVEVLVFDDRIEIRGLIPTQTVQRVFQSVR